MWNKIAELCNLHAPSGYEGAASALASGYIKPFVDEIKTDALGSVYGIKTVNPSFKTLLLDAHMDEIGVMITGHEGGFLRFRTVGGIDPRMLMAREIRLLSGHYGVVACVPPHVQERGEADKSVDAEDLFIDIGLDDASCVPVGTVGVFDVEFLDMGDCVTGKSLDNRLCLMAVLRALELAEAPKFNLIIAATVQEEVGGRGAKAAAFGQAPDLCLVVDVTHGQTPDASKDMTFQTGGGPCVGIAPGIDKAMSGRLKKLAKEQNIPYQLEVMGGDTSTNGGDYQISREGIPTAELYIPIKYMHSPVELARKDDFENTAKLIAAFIDRGVTE